MGLKIWLPLTHDLTNHGSSTGAITNNGATFSSSGGKMGGCYTFDGSDDYIALPSQTINSSGKLTFTCWYYHTAAASWARLIELSNSNADGATNKTAIGISLGDNGSTLTIWGRYNGNYSPSGTTALAISTGTWHHVAMVLNGTNVKTYIDGVEKNSLTITSRASIVHPYVWIGKSTWTADKYLNGKMNDVRLYDEALSAKEIEVIARGLCVHYPLAQADHNPNLFSDLATKYSSSFWGYSLYSPTTGATQKPVQQGNGDVILYGAGTAGSEQAYLANSGNKVTLSASTTYTISVRVKSKGATNFRIYWYDYNSSGTSVYSGSQNFALSDGQTKLCSWTRTTSSTCATCYWELNSMNNATTTQITLYANSLKLEAGTIPYSEYSPSNATTYSLTEYDVSGMDNDGSVASATAPIYATGGPRYKGYYNFNTASKIITGPSPAFITGGTISLWVKVTTMSSSGWLPLVGQDGGHYVMASSAGTGAFYNGSTTGTLAYYEDGVAVSAPSNLTAGWHHICMTGPNLSAWTIFKINGYSGWQSCELMSDFRVYSTALSAAAVKELY